MTMMRSSRDFAQILKKMDAKSDFKDDFPPVEEWDQHIEASKLCSTVAAIS